MAEHEPREDRIEPQATNTVKKTYELQDVGARPVIVFLVLMLIFLAMIHYIIYGMIKHYVHQRPFSASPQVELARGRPAPPPPRLQTNPVADLERMLSEQKFYLNSYGWVDRRAGIVHIPIEQAIDEVAAHGLPPKRVDNATTLGQIILHRLYGGLPND